MSAETVTRVLRRLGSDVQHVADVMPSSFTGGAMLGRRYTGVIAPVAARCGRVLRSRTPLVCMRPGTRVTCRACARISGTTDASSTNSEFPNGVTR